MPSIPKTDDRSLSHSTPSSESVPIASELEPKAIARRAGLRYVGDDRTGIQRKGAGKGFYYLNSKGERIRDRETLKRIRALVIPPSWQDVWICPLENGHLQATGRDARGRKQYRYHAKWRSIRDQTKFDRIVAFGRALPTIRRVTDEHLRSRQLSREKILALVVQLLERTLIRVGNDEYARANQSFGLTTLQQQHVEVSATKVRFQFRGKSGVEHEIELNDRRLARAIGRCQELPGQELFQYIDAEGNCQGIDSGEVNDYLRQITGQEFTAKDFRTWAGTAETAWRLEELGPAETKTERQAHIRQAVKQAAQRLGNRVATCRKYYIHPAVLAAYEAGTLIAALEREPAIPPAELAANSWDLQPKEQALLALLEAQ